MIVRKEHVKAKEWQMGGFHVDRYVECRCGFTASHYNRGFLNEVFKLHQADPTRTLDELEREAHSR